MSIRFDNQRVERSHRADTVCPACGRGIDCRGLASRADVVTAHLRHSCRATRPTAGDGSLSRR